MKKIIKMFFSFMFLGLKSIGNISSVAPMIEEEFVIKNKWLEKEDIVDAIAIGRCGPGAAIVNTMVFLGNKIYGVLGGIIAPIAFCIIPFIIITTISIFIDEFLKNTIIMSMFKAISVSIVIMIINTVISLAKNVIVDKLTASIFIIILCMCIFTNISTIIYIIISSIIGLIITLLKKKS